MSIKKNFGNFLRTGKPSFPEDASLQNVFLYGLRVTLFWGSIGCSLLYQALIRIRAALYRRKILRQAVLPCPVISVGNITAGGTGKTPTVIEIARVFSQHQRRVAVLSRGYRRDDSSSTLVVEPESDVSQVGDEPLLMMRKFHRELRPPLPCPSVIVGRRRYRSGLMALERFQPDVLLLDDGFQHMQLARDCDLVLIDATNPFGGGYMLPAGFLREPVPHLRRASAFVITRSNEVPECKSIFRTLERLNSAAPVFTAIHAFGGFRELEGHSPISAEKLAERRLLAVSGLGNPGSFRRLLGEVGLRAVESLDFFDHHCYDERDGLTISRMCRERKLNALVTSEKDESKLLPHVENLNISCYVMMVKLVIQPEKGFEELLLSYL